MLSLAISMRVKNFFFYEPEEDYDCIISNPPFSIKDDIFDAALRIR